MRRVRMLGLCLIALFAISALTVASASAGIVKNPTQKLNIYKNCPFKALGGNGKTVEDCVFQATEPGPEGGSFTVGPITVPLEKQVQVQFGIDDFLDVYSNEFEEAVAPINGAPELVPTPEKVPGQPIAHITEAEQNEEGWPIALKYSYAQAQRDGAAKKVYETIEGAGVAGQNAINVIEEQGIGVRVPVKVKGENKWISELGDVCYIGSEEDPITQHLTTGVSVSPLTGEEIHGAKGEAELFDEGNALLIAHNELVDNTYAVPGASCTGPYSSYIEAAIDHIFGIPAPAGASKTVLKGSLYTADAAYLEAHLHH